MADKRTNEGFSLDAKGIKQDADFHAELLTTEADLASIEISKAQLRNSGYSENDLQILFGKRND